MAASGKIRTNNRVLQHFVRWLEQPSFDPRYAKKWAKLYRSNREAAMCEATYWAVLADCGVDVYPNESLDGRGKSPDYRCVVNGEEFYVEVTCILLDSATRSTGLDAEFDHKRGARHYALLTDTIFGECVNKTPQCASARGPCLLAIGTFHPEASCLVIRKRFIEELITGETGIGHYIDGATGRGVGAPFVSSSLRFATFSKLTLSGVQDARQPISGLLIGGFGDDPPRLYGALHPNPIHSFKPGYLARIPFCSQTLDLVAGEIGAIWNSDSVRE